MGVRMPGIGVRIESESVAGFNRNGCPDGSGISNKPLPTPLSGRNRSRGRDRFRRDEANHGGSTASGKRSKKVKEQHGAIRDWESQHRGMVQQDPSAFREQVLPKLQQFTLSELAEATGLSRSYCGRIRSGDVVRHQRHWGSLKQMV